MSLTRSIFLLSDGRVGLEWLFEPPAHLSRPGDVSSRPHVAGATAMRGGELGALTARGLVDAQKNGFRRSEPVGHHRAGVPGRRM